MIDVEVARTFLKVAETRSFQLAAEFLNVTQSTVSARVRTLEDRLGCKVFERTRAGASLTVNGKAFQRYAAAIVHAWEEGKREATEPRARITLRLGGEHNLWTRLLALWLLELRGTLHDVDFVAEAAGPELLMRGLLAGQIDIAVLNRRPPEGDFRSAHLMDDDVVLVTTDPGGGYKDRYIGIIWGGSQIPNDIARSLGASTTARIDLGFASINYLMLSQSAGYVPRRLAQPYVDAGHLFIVDEAPAFAAPIHAVWRLDAEEQVITRSLETLSELADLASRGELPPPFWSQMV